MDGHGDVVDVELRVAGEQRRHVGVRPEAEHHDLELAAAVGAELVAVRRGAGLRRLGGLGGRHRVDERGVDVDLVEERLPGLALVAVGGRRLDEPLVAPPEHHPAPVDLAADLALLGEPGQLAVDRVGDRAAGEREMGYAAVRLGVDEPGQQLTRHRDGERLLVLVDLDPRLGAAHRRCLR